MVTYKKGRARNQNIKKGKIPMKIDWKKKLSSRKFWAALLGYVTAIMAAFNLGESMIAQVSAVLAGVGALVTYLLAEARVDAARMSASEAPHMSASEAPHMSASEAPHMSASEAPRMSASEAPHISASEAPHISASEAPHISVKP
jgi:phosphate/sulfate permease